MAVIERIINTPRFHLQQRQRREALRRQRPSRIEILTKDELAGHLPKTERGWQKFVDFFEEGAAKCRDDRAEAERLLEEAIKREKIHDSRATRARLLFNEWKQRQ